MRVAPLVRGDSSVSCFGERAELVAPLVGGLRKPVEEDHDLSVVRTGHADIEREIADSDLSQGDLASGRIGFRAHLIRRSA